MKRNRWFIHVAALALSQFVFFGNSVAATTAPAGNAQAQEVSKEEADAYKAFFDANAAKDSAKSMEYAKAYLQKYPGGKYAAYLKGWIPKKRAEMFNMAMQARNIDEMIRIGKEALAEDSQNVDYLYLLVLTIRTNELSASPPNFSHANDALDFSERTVRLIDADKVPAVIPKDKYNKNTVLAWLYQGMAIIEGSARKNPAKALDYYTKASSYDPSDPYNYLISGSLLQAKYVEAAKKFQEIPEADRTAPEAEMKPEVKAALDAVNKAADDVINTWARFLGLTATRAEYASQRNQVEKVVADLYKYRHPEDPTGFQKLIDQNKPGTASPNGTSGN
jgi:hypothetical protein